MRTIKNKNGVTLLIVVMYFLVLVILLGGLFFATIGNFKNQNTSTSHTSAFYNAESGINIAMKPIEDIIAGNPTETEFINAMTEYIDNELNTNPMDDNSINIEIDGDDGLYTITSTGIVNGQTRILQKTIHLTYVINGGFTTEYGLLGLESIKIGNNFLITGSDSATYGTANIDAEYLTGDPYDELPAIVFGDLSNCNASFIRCKVKDFETVHQNVTVPSATLLNYNTKHIDSLNFTGEVVVNDDIIIWTNSLVLNNATFSGNGRLEIYVTSNNVTLNGITGNKNNPENLLIYVDGSGTINFNNLNGLYGSFMLNNISIDGSNNNGLSFIGYLLSNGTNIKFKNGFSGDTYGIFYFPNGTFEIKNSSNSIEPPDFTGAIIAKEIIAKNNFNILFITNGNNTLPFELANPLDTTQIYTDGGATTINYTYDPTTEVDN